MASHARGTFEIKLAPQTDVTGDPSVGRLSFDKQFSGDLEGTSKGQMLATRTDVKGSAGYVAMERVQGTLHGREGTFALQHSGTMDRGASSLTVSVVPDSGTGELTGLSGALNITIDGGIHYWTFDYELPATTH